jgi:hypothetical protein
MLSGGSHNISPGEELNIFVGMSHFGWFTLKVAIPAVVPVNGRP